MNCLHLLLKPTHVKFTVIQCVNTKEIPARTSHSGYKRSEMLVSR